MSPPERALDAPRPSIVPPVSEVRPIVQRAAGATKVLPGIQALRAIAALAVLVHHVLEESQPLFGGRLPHWLVLSGACGVDLFFVISGFIMLHTQSAHFSRRTAGPGLIRRDYVSAALRFARRRLVRIYPLYWACLAVLLAARASGVLYRNLHFTRTDLVASILLFPAPTQVLHVAWTLVFEMTFYAVFALWLWPRRAEVAMAGILVTLFGLMVTGASFGEGALYRYWGNPIALEFTYGLVLAYLVGRGARVPLAGWLAAAGVALIVVTSLMGPSLGTAGLARGVRFALWGVPAAMMVPAFVQWTARGTVGRVLERLGDASYALYLTHGFVMTSYARLLKTPAVVGRLPAGAWMALAIVVSIALGWLTHRYVEQPLLRRLRPLAR